MGILFDSLSCNPNSLTGGEDLWDERLRGGCADHLVNLLEAGSIRPLVFPDCHTSSATYRSLRAIWANAVLNPRTGEEQIDSSFLSARNPFIKSHQPSQALSFLLAQKSNRTPFPLAPVQFSSGGAICSSANEVGEGRSPQLAELCQLALLWLLCGKQEAARNLTHWLLSFATSGKPLLSLWSPENRYDETEGLLSFSLLFRSLGLLEESNSLLRCVQKPIDPFFLALAQEMRGKLQDLPPFPAETSDPVFGLTCWSAKNITAAYTLTGFGTSLGVVRSGPVEIRALGPQILPLSGVSGFGIGKIPDGTAVEKWTCCFGLPEVWIEVKTKQGEVGSHLDLRFVGLKPESPLAFVFYVKAESCRIGNELLKPKSLHRYIGDGKGSGPTIFFQGEKSSLQIDSALSHKVQIIPLAGEGCFWDCEFLVSFEIHPLEAQAGFLFSTHSVKN